MKNLFLLIIISIIGPKLIAQDILFTPENFPNQSEFKTIKGDLIEGYEFFEEQNYFSAVPLLEKANKFNPQNAKLNLRLGICYLHTNNKYLALEYIENSQKIKVNISYHTNYYLGEAHHYLMNFIEAKSYYHKYLSQIEEGKQEVENIKKSETITIPTVKRKIQECKNGIALKDNRSSGMIINLRNINTEYTDHSPMLTADGNSMIFTSRRQNKDNEIDAYDMQYYEDIYITYLEDKKWSEPIPISSALNSKHHDSNVGMSNDGQNIYVYNSNNGHGEIYRTSINGIIWSTPVPVPEPINSPYNEKCISVSPDKKMIYFVSDRPGGEGNLDIYFAEKDINENYTKISNLGDVINTEYDEDGVFIHPDGKTLYFSSKGHNTIGGYDIFKSVRDSNNIWSTPVNLGEPINSADNDISIFVSSDGKTGYFSSVKEGGIGEEDIYKIFFSEEDEGYNKSELLLAKGVIIDAITKKPIEATIEIINNTTQEKISTFKSNKETGEFMISLAAGKDYALTVISKDHLFFSQNFNLTNTSNYIEVELKMEMEHLAKNAKTILRNIFFDYGKTFMKSESGIEADRLFKLLNEHLSIKIEIGGHTDNISSKRFNKELSKKRANSVANYLIDKGISRNRIKTKGYAFSKPIESNATEEGREKNRRVEITIISY